MPFGLCCDCVEFDWVSCKAFDADGGFLWEDKLLDIFESPDGTVRALRLRDISTTAPWTVAGLVTLTSSNGTNTTSIPAKTGTAPTGRYKQWAVDAVEVDPADGTITTLAADIDLLSVLRSGTSGYAYHGIPTYTPRLLRTQLPACNDDGICIFRTMPSGANATLQIVMFDAWRQATTSRYRIPPARPGQTTGQSYVRFTSAATDVDVDWNASAATIEAALETLPNVVSAAVSGGPLTLAAVDIEVEWASATDQFTSITTIKMYQLTSYESSLYDLTTGQIVGRIESSTYDGTRLPCWSSSGNLIGEKLVSSIRHIRSFSLSSDGFGGIITGGTYSWTLAVAPDTLSLSSLGYGKIVMSCPRTVVSGANRTHAIIDESSGTLDGYGNTAFEAQYSSIFRSSSLLGITGEPIGGGKSTSGEQFTEMPNTGGDAPGGWLLGGNPFGYISTDAIITITAGTDLAVDGQVLDGVFAGVFSSTFVSTSINVEAGGDGFFPITTYRRHTIYPFGLLAYWNPNYEWRLRFGPTSSPALHATPWYSYGESEATVDADLKTLLGNNSAGLPVLQIAFTSTGDNAITPVPVYAQGITIVGTAANAPGDETTYSLMPNDYRMTIEYRNATLRIQRAIAAVQTSDSTVQWQRDIGEAASRFASLSKNNHILVTGDVIIANCYNYALKKPLTHPTLVVGPLP